MIFNFFKNLFKFKELVFSLLYLELNSKHAGQKLGIAWSLLNPLILMFIYAFLFVYVFPAKFQNNEIEVNYTLNIFAGLISWLVTQDVINKSCNVLKNNKNLIKQISFPLETIPIKTVFGSYFNFFFAFIFVLIYSLYSQLSLDKLFLTIVLILIQLIFLIGISCIISVFALIFKDIQEAIYFFNTVNLFALPILYSPNATPEWLNIIFLLNPFSYLVVCWQDILFKGYISSYFNWTICILITSIIFLFGISLFRKLKNFIGDYI